MKGYQTIHQMKKETDRNTAEAKKAQALIVAKVRHCLKDPDMRDVLALILEMSGINYGIFGETLQMAHSEGRRSMGLQVLDLIHLADPTAYPRMLLKAANTKEAKDGRTTKRPTE